jgi:hypothetical protein
MFSKHFKARLARSAIFVQKVKKEDKRLISIKLVYDFTAELAECMGPRAVAILGTLEADKKARLTMSSGNIKLDTKKVAATFRYQKTQVYAIEETTSIVASVAAPTAQSATPSLEVTLTMTLEQEHLDFVGDYLNEALQVRLDREQTEVAGTQGDGKKK